MREARCARCKSVARYRYRVASVPEFPSVSEAEALLGCLALSTCNASAQLGGVSMFGFDLADFGWPAMNPTPASQGADSVGARDPPAAVLAPGGRPPPCR